MVECVCCTVRFGAIAGLATGCVSVSPHPAPLSCGLCCESAHEFPGPFATGARTTGGSPTRLEVTWRVITSDSAAATCAIASPQASTGTGSAYDGRFRREAREQSAREQKVSTRYHRRPCSTRLKTSTLGGER
eukprot:scaffold104956_cov28-Tisochrysis_lutea.AAC.13